MIRTRDPGRRVVASGSLRVDASRAVAGLRQHLLLDLGAYLHEVARAAVAGGASAIDLDHDADDVVVRFDGAPVPASALARLLDHVLVEARGPEERRLWLIALGVNAALGLGPAFVEVTSWGHADHEGEAVTARFTGEAHARPEAAAPRVTRGPAPAGGPGVRVQVRRKLGWDVVRRAAAGGVPAEIASLCAASGDLAIPLRIATAVVTPGRAAEVLSVAFDVPGARAARLVVTAPGVEPPTIDLAEHGVRLVRYAFRPPPGFPAAPHGGVSLPVRVVVDAPALPTNASRSALREDAALLLGAVEGAAAALPIAVRGLVDALAGRPAATRDVTIATADPRAIEGALGALACVVAGGALRGEPLSDAARAVLDAPLLRDGAGRPMAPTVLLGAATQPIHVWKGDAPLDAALAPWLGDVVWARGHVAEGALAGLSIADAKDLVARAKVGLERRRALHDHPASAPHVQPAADHFARESFRFDAGPLAGLQGEVALPASGVGARGAVVRVWLEGRHLATVTRDARACPLPLDAAVAWDGRLRPRFEYDGVAGDAALGAAIDAAVQAGVRLAARAARELSGLDEGAAARLAAVLRAAVGAATVGAEGSPGLTADDPLREARIWPTTDGRVESLASIARGLGAARAILVAGPRARGVALGGRTVLATEASERAAIARALGDDVAVVDYERALFASEAAVRGRERARGQALAAALADRVDRAEGEALPRLAFTRPGVRGLAGPTAGPSRLVHLHAGIVLGETPLAAWLGPVVLAVDDDATTPDAAWAAVAHTPSAFSLGEVEEALCASVVAAVEGDRPAGGATGAARLGPTLRGWLLRAARALRREVDMAAARADGADDDGAEARRALLSRIEALPLLCALDATGTPRPVTPAEVLARAGGVGPIAVVDAPPGFPTLDWEPVVLAVRGAPIVDLEALRAWAGSRVELADEAAIEARGLRARRAAGITMLRARSAEDVRAFAPGVARGGAPVAVTTTLEGEAVAATLPATPREGARATALFEGRPLLGGTIDVPGAPVVARVDLRDEGHVDSDAYPTRAGVERVFALVARGAAELARSLVAGASGPGRAGLLLADPAAIAVVLAALRAAAPAASRPRDLDAPLDTATLLATLESLRAPSGDGAHPVAASLVSPALLWPTVQGDERPLGDLLSDGAALSFGRDRFVAWVGPAGAPARLDAPVLWLPATPAGAGARALLEGLGRALRDETAAIAELAARRAAGRPREPPKLAGAPPHPALRASLASLDVFSAEGEIEILPAPPSEVTLADLDGTTRDVPATLPVPLRAVARVDAAPSREGDTETCKDLSRACVRLLREITATDADLPVFVRDHQRALACRTLVRRRKLAKADLRSRVFPDTQGRFHALGDLVAALGEGGAWPTTKDPPPWPARAYDPPVIALSEAEAKAVGHALALTDVTLDLRRDRAGELRAAAPQRPTIALDPLQRGACLRVVAVAEAGLEGEIGLLAPGEAGRRGVSVHVGRRSLCWITDEPGWPIVGVVEARDLVPNDRFDGPRDAGDLEPIRAALREAALREARAWLAAPDGAIASRLVDATVGASTRHATRVLGTIWLPRAWPAAPRVRLAAPGLPPGGDLAPLRVASPPAGLDGAIPVEGSLLVLPQARSTSARAAGDAVGELAAALAPGLVEEAAARGDAPADAIEAYRWDLRLLGRRGGALDAARPAPTTDPARAVSPDDVLAELAARGAIWAAGEGASVDGDFPRGTPAFFLRAEAGGAPFTVLGARALPDAFRRLGEPARPAPAADPEPDPPAPPSAPARRPETSWLAGLVQSAIALVRPPPPPETPAAKGLRAAVQSELARLALTGDAVAAVELVTSGRAVRYDRARRVVLVNRRHRAVAPLLAAPATRAAPLLAAAALAEVNRALVEVTDAEELRALDLLLGDPPSRGAEKKGG